MATKFRVTADNPHGLNYDHTTEDGGTVAGVVARISNRGGTNIRLNGHLMPDEAIASARRAARYSEGQSNGPDDARRD